MAVIDSDLQAAYAYTFPYYEMARTRYVAVGFAGNPQRADVNTLNHSRTLRDHTARNVTTPNSDTLYSSAWLDVSAGPLLLTVPKIAARYWSVQFMDATTSTAALIGSRNAGEGALSVWIVRDNDTTPAPAGAKVVRLPTRDAWMLVRIGVDSPGDLPAVHAHQNGMQLRVVNQGAVSASSSLSGSPSSPSSPVAPLAPRGSPENGANYLAVVNDMLARSSVPAAERAMLSQWSRFGIGVASPTAEQAATITAALPDLNARLRASDGLNAGAKTTRRWSYPNPAIGTYGSDYALRAAVALGGLGALPPEEAIYLSAAGDSTGQSLDGAYRYRVRIPATGIDAQAFWSLSMYQIEPDGRLFFIDNPIKRYTVGDRTQGLIKSADGSIELAVQREQPETTEQKANWLPAPSGPFSLILRAYLPSPDLAQGKAPLPTVERMPLFTAVPSLALTLGLAVPGEAQ